MNTRGQGRIFTRKGSPNFYVAYYDHGEEIREPARHVRTGEKLKIGTEKNRHEAERFLKHRLGELAAEKHGGRAFVGPQRERITVNELLDSLERDYKLRDKWIPSAASGAKPVREHFGTHRAVDVTSDAITAYIEGMREQGYAKATINRTTQLLGQAY